MTKDFKKEKIKKLFSKIKSGFDSSKPVDYISNQIIKMNFEDIEEILHYGCPNNNLFGLFVERYLQFGDKSFTVVKYLFKNYFYDPNKLGQIIGALLRTNKINRPINYFGSLLEQALRYYYDKYKKLGSVYFKDKGGIGFIVLIIIAVGKFKVLKAIPLLKEIIHDQKWNEPSLSRAAEEAFNNLSHASSTREEAILFKDMGKYKIEVLIDKLRR